jgi:hypothetical protein
MTIRKKINLLIETDGNAGEAIGKVVGDLVV